MIKKYIIVLGTFVFGFTSKNLLETFVDFGASITCQPYMLTASGEKSTIVWNQEISLIASAISVVGFISLYIFVPITYTGVAIGIGSVLIGGTVLEYAAKWAAGELDEEGIDHIFVRHIGRSLGVGLYVYLSLTSSSLLITLSSLFTVAVLILNLTEIGRIDNMLSMIYSGLSIDLLSKKAFLHSFQGYSFTHFEWVMAVFLMTFIVHLVHILREGADEPSSVLIVLCSSILLALGLAYGTIYPILTTIIFQFTCWSWLQFDKRLS